MDSTIVSAVIGAVIGAVGTIVAAAVPAFNRFLRARVKARDDSAGRNASDLLDAIELPVFILNSETKMVSWVNEYMTKAFNRSRRDLETMAVHELIEYGVQFISTEKRQEEAIAVFRTQWARFLQHPRLPVQSLPFAVKYPNGLQGPATVTGFPIYTGRNKNPQEVLVIVFVDHDGSLHDWATEAHRKQATKRKEDA